MRRDRTVVCAAAALALLLLAAVAPASGQVATSCTATLITTFTPCLNFVTGSTNGGGGSPTQQCCGSLAEMVRTSADCACLVLTGNVPFSLPINRTLAVSLPKLCNSMSVPLQCRDTAAQIPAPGPIAFSPGLPPLPPSPPEPSLQPDSQVDDPTAMSPAGESPPISQRPVVVPSSARKSSHASMAAVAIVLSLAASILA